MSCPLKGPSSIEELKEAKEFSGIIFIRRKDAPANSVGHTMSLLKQSVHKYNSFHSYFNLKDLSPYEYISKLSLEANLVSYVLN